jgi:hypothetical protein
MHASNCCGLNKIHQYNIPTVIEFGFINNEDPFIVDGDEVLEIHEMYLKNKITK